MIQDYEIKDSSVTAYDDKKGLINYKYQDNIDDILIQENIIEQINEDLDFTHTNILNLNNEINNYSIKLKKLEKIVYVSLLLSVFCICIGAITNIIGGLTTCLISAIVTTISSFKIGDNEDKIIELQKQLNGLQLQEEQFKNLLDIQKQKLNDLKNNKTNNTNIIKNENFKSENKRKLEDIIHLKNLYYTIGYHIKELKKYYEEGTLRKNLEPTVFSDKDLAIVEGIIVKKGPQLIKRKDI